MISQEEWRRRWFAVYGAGLTIAGVALVSLASIRSGLDWTMVPGGSLVAAGGRFFFLAGYSDSAGGRSELHGRWGWWGRSQDASGEAPPVLQGTQPEAAPGLARATDGDDMVAQLDDLLESELEPEVRRRQPSESSDPGAAP
jgi:hypothetical protein